MVKPYDAKKSFWVPDGELFDYHLENVFSSQNKQDMSSLPKIVRFVARNFNYLLQGEGGFVEGLLDSENAGKVFIDNSHLL